VAAVRSKFTRMPKVHSLILAGVPTEVIPTYAALSDYSNNKTGLCWPKMETLAKTLRRSARTVQRHLHLLKDLGLIEFVERKRDGRGKFGAYIYRILHIAASASSKATGHARPMAPLNRKTRRGNPPNNPPKKSVTEGYGWLFGDPASPEQNCEADERRRRDAERRKEGYEWLFK
jgi:DNA-binding transcriptional ArsR family regulator